MREIDEKTRTVSKELLEVPEIAQAIALSEESAYTVGELDYYQSYWDSVSREKTLISEKYAEGKAEGLTEGRREMAKKMLKRGLSAEVVSEDTGLTLAEIEALDYF